MDLMAIRRGLMMASKKRLPSEYQEVEWIRSVDGYTYINTEIVPVGDEVHIITEVEATTTSQDTTVFGSVNFENDIKGNATLSRIYHMTPYSSKWYFGTNNVEKSAGVYSNTVGSRYAISYNDSNHSISVNGDEIYSNGQFSSLGIPICINMRGNYESGNGYCRRGLWKFFYFKILDNVTGKNLANFVPCYRISDNKVGMYDLVRKRFFEPEGVGTFVAGPAA